MLKADDDEHPFAGANEDGDYWQGQQSKSTREAVRLTLPDDDLEPLDNEQQQDEEGEQVRHNIFSTIGIRGQLGNRDRAWGLIFWFQLLLVLVLMFSSNSDASYEGRFPAAIGAAMLFDIVLSCVLSIAMFAFIFKSPVRYVTFIKSFCLVSLVLLNLWLMVEQSWFLASLCFLLFFASGLWMHHIRDSVEAAKAMLEVAVRALKQQPEILKMLSLLFAFHCAFLAFWTIAMTKVLHYESAFLYYLCSLLLVLSLYWTHQVLCCLLQVISCHSIAHFYQNRGGAASDMNVATLVNPPTITGRGMLYDESLLIVNICGKQFSGPIVKGLHRVATFSAFSSICFGAAVIPICKFLKQCFGRALPDEDAKGMRRLWQTLSVYVQSAHQSGNRYGLIEISLMGKDMRQGSKDAWALLEETGFEAAVRDDATAPLMTLTCFAVASVVTLVCGLFARTVIHEEVWVEVVFLLGCIAFCQQALFVAAFESVIACLFLYVAEDPAPFAEIDSIIYHRITRLAELGGMQF